MHLKRRRIHFRVLKLDPGEELRHAKESISFSAESYITDPPFPPDRMTYVIYHMGPSQTTGRGGKPGPCDAASSPSHCTQYRWLAERALLIWRREREEGGDAGVRGGEPACMDGWVCGVAGTRLAEAPLRLCSLILSAKPHCSASEALLTPPTPRIPFLFFPPLLVVKGKKKKRASRADRYHSAALACEGWYK